MSLSDGTRIGPYEIQSALSAGGMGEVYRARDTRLDRVVAIKVLPPGVADDPQRQERFGREARAISSLSHPRICTVYDGGHQVGIDYLVMELLEGQTLAERLEKGALPLDQALQYAIEIADALDAAHRLGIVHRDLKPANVMLTKAGAKLLDFGIAKAVASRTATSAAPPTLTVEGTLLGTLQYMAPEQLEGREADARSDLFCVRRGVLRDADRTSCVRWREPVERRQLHLPGVSPQPRPVRLPWSVAAVASLVALIAVGALAWYMRTGLQPPAAAPRVTRTTIAAWGGASPAIATGRGLAITPDGTRIVYIGNNGAQLFVRQLDGLDATAIYTSVAPLNWVFVSPDGQWIGFDEGGTLKKMALTGGPAETILNTGNGSSSGTWAPDETIIFATPDSATGLQRVSAAGGNVNVLTRPVQARGEADHLWPEMLRGGRAVLFTITATTGGLDAAQVGVLDLSTGMPTVLAQDNSRSTSSRFPT